MKKLLLITLSSSFFTLSNAQLIQNRIQAHQPLSVTARVSSATLCYGDSTTLFCTPSGEVKPYTFQWSGQAIACPACQNTTAAPAASSTYTITVTDELNNTATATVTVRVDHAINLALSANVTNPCKGDTVKLSALVSGGTNPYAYSWTPAAPLNNSSIDNPYFIANVSKAFTCKVTDSLGCQVSSSMTVNVDGLTVGVVDPKICPNTVTSLTANVTGANAYPPYTYLWSPSGQTGQTATGLSAGAYTLTVSDANGCSATALTHITLYPAPKFNAVSNLNNFLVYGFDSMTATGGTPPYTYTWLPGIGAGSVLSIPAQKTTYTLTVTDANGCSSSDTATLYPISTAGGCGSLFISEYIQDTVNHDDAIEIYNPTGHAIGLGDYYLGGTTNGSMLAPPFLIKLHGAIGAHKTFLIANTNADTGLTNKAKMLTDSLNFGGKDIVELNYLLPTQTYVQSTLLDVIGNINQLPSDTGWAVGNGSTKNHTLVRQQYVAEGTTQWQISQYQWNVYPRGTFSYIGHFLNVCNTAGDPAITFQLVPMPSTCGNPSYVNFAVMAASTGNNTIFNNCTIDIKFPYNEFYPDSPSNGIIVRQGSDFPNNPPYNDYAPPTVTFNPFNTDTVIEIQFGNVSDSSPHGTLLTPTPDTLLIVSLQIQNGCKRGDISFINTPSADYTYPNVIVNDTNYLYCCMYDTNNHNCAQYCDTMYAISTYTLYPSYTYSSTNYSGGSINPLTCPLTITDFNAPIDAGIGNVLTITGNNFGNTRGTGQVKFYDPDSAHYIVQKLNYVDYKSWTNNQIQIILPSFADSILPPPNVTTKFHIGGGNFIVKNSCGDSAVSGNNLNNSPFSVFYSISQTWNPNTSQKDEVLLRKVDTNGGYVFRLDSNTFPHHSIQRLIFAKAVREWVCYTGVNWSIGADTTINYSVRGPAPIGYGINYVFFTPALLPNIPSRTNPWELPCSNYNTAQLDEGDIYFNSHTDFVYDTTETDPISGPPFFLEVDFYGACLHELGHLMPLEHSRDSTSLMYYTANTGPILAFNRLTLASAGSAAAVDGGIYSVNQSIHNSDYCDGYPTMIPKNIGCVNSLGINEVKNSNTFTIYPNPSMGAFTIETDVNDYTLVITNLLGQKILIKKINTEKAEISLFKQAEGMYFIQEQYQNGTATQKLILIK